MGRHTKIVTVSKTGRDSGKQFFLTEMAADQGEDWANRMTLMFSRGGLDVPPGIFERGFAGLAELMPYVLVVGLDALKHVQYSELKPLLQELLACVKFVPPGTKNPDAYIEIFAGLESQVEEVPTRWWLELQVLELHLGFSVADALSKFKQQTSTDPAAVSVS